MAHACTCPHGDVRCRWLAKPASDPSYRAFMIYGGAGLGKSAIAAALVNQGITIGNGDGRAAVAGSYFFKFDDSE
jgi:hypothetical protein